MSLKCYTNSDDASGMREISEKEAAELGIDLTMIKVCRRFRHLAKLDRLRIDMTEHRSGLNKHLLFRQMLTVSR